jgi:glutamine cyclotransferase
MKKYNSLLIILLSFTFINIGCSSKKSDDLFKIDNTSFKPKYTFGDDVSVMIINKENKAIDSIVYFINDEKFAKQNNIKTLKVELKTQKLGYLNIKALVYFEGNPQPADVRERIELVSNVQPKLLKYKIVNTFPHDTTSFTEGLEFYRDTLFEGTGLRGKSHLLKTDYKTGKILKSLALDAKYFGEGITIINNKIYQLTWEENVGFIYNVDTWKLEKTFAYDKKIEGWGMTNDGKYIYHSDGTEKIWKMSPENQKMISFVNVYSGSEKIKSVNELEWIEGKIYGNVWQKDAIAIINPENGSVEAILDLSGLRKLISYKKAEVLNGIAYNPRTKTVFVTGKNWEKIFEIKVVD